MRLWLIHVLDWLDYRVLQHHFPWICDRIGESQWWADHDCWKGPCRWRARYVAYLGPDAFDADELAASDRDDSYACPHE